MDDSEVIALAGQVMQDVEEQLQEHSNKITCAIEEGFENLVTAILSRKIKACCDLCLEADHVAGLHE